MGMDDKITAFMRRAVRNGNDVPYTIVQLDGDINDEWSQSPRITSWPLLHPHMNTAEFLLVRNSMFDVNCDGFCHLVRLPYNGIMVR